MNFFGSDEKRVDYAAAVEGSSSSSSSLVVPEQSSRSSSVAVTERTDISMMRGCSSSSSCNLMNVLSTQAISSNNSSVSPSFVYTFQNCTVHHVGSSMPNSSS